MPTTFQPGRLHDFESPDFASIQSFQIRTLKVSHFAPFYMVRHCILQKYCIKSCHRCCVDSNRFPEYGRSFGMEPDLMTLNIPSAVERIPGAKTYRALFENLIQALLKNTQELSTAFRNYGNVCWWAPIPV